MKTKIKSAAIVTIHDAPNMSRRGRNHIAAWLEKQAGFLRRNAGELGPRFRARYLYTLGMVVLLVGVSALPVMGQGLNSKISAAEPKSPKFKFVTLATGTAVQASTTNLQFTSATFYGVSAVSATAAPTVNSGTAYIGFVDATGASGVAAASPAFCDSITAGSYVSLAQTGGKYNLTDIYLLGATGDKILIVYTQ